MGNYNTVRNRASGEKPGGVQKTNGRIQLYPHHFRANTNIIYVQRRLSRNEEANTYFTRSAQLRPNSVQGNLNAGFWLIFAARLTEAEPYLQRAIRLAGSLPAEQQNKLLAEWWLDFLKIHEFWVEGNLHSMLEMMDYSKEKLPFRMIQELSWRSFFASQSLAEAWLREGKLENAVQVLEKASQQKQKALDGRSDWMRIQIQLAQLYRKQGRHAKAEKIEAELRKLLTYADPDFWMVQELSRQNMAAR